MFDDWSDRGLFGLITGVACSLWFGIGVLAGFVLGGNALWLAAVFLGAGIGSLAWIMHRMGEYIAGQEAQNALAEELDLRLMGKSRLPQ